MLAQLSKLDGSRQKRLDNGEFGQSKLYSLMCAFTQGPRQSLRTIKKVGIIKSWIIVVAVYYMLLMVAQACSRVEGGDCVFLLWRRHLFTVFLFHVPLVYMCINLYHG